MDLQVEQLLVVMVDQVVVEVEQGQDPVEQEIHLL